MDNKTLIQQAKQNVDLISEKFLPFSSEYEKYEKGTMDFDNLIQNFQSKLEVMSWDERWEYNEMHKIFSRSNCWYADYRSGELIHKILMNMKYNEEIND